jgi:hypothetical protein
MGQLAEKYPTAGISPHVHALICQAPSMIEFANDRTSVSAEGARTEFKMPKVATTYRGFLAMCSEPGRRLSAAVTGNLSSLSEPSFGPYQEADIDARGVVVIIGDARHVGFIVYGRTAIASS